MVIMALDHARDYFTSFTYDPTDLEHTTPALFFTRWITHYCAPVFVFLSGTSAFLASRNQTKQQTARQLLSRGIWLVVLEFTVVRFGWQFNLDFSLLFVQVIWAIGWSMIVLALLIFLPVSAILALSLVMIFGHNLLDAIPSASWGKLSFLWNILHEQGAVRFGEGNVFFVLYPLVPWVGVMALGYCTGRIFLLPEGKRRMSLAAVGLSSIVLFILLRYINVYGDLSMRDETMTGWRYVASFLNCTKYPPSLLYLLMTLGPAFCALYFFEQTRNRFTEILKVYGSVPLFYYVLHIYLLHGMAMLTAVTLGFPASLFYQSGFGYNSTGWGFGLTGVYLAWIVAVALLYFPSKWWARQKQIHRKWWMSYL